MSRQGAVGHHGRRSSGDRVDGGLGPEVLVAALVLVDERLDHVDPYATAQRLTVSDGRGHRRHHRRQPRDPGMPRQREPVLAELLGLAASPGLTGVRLVMPTPTPGSAPPRTAPSRAPGASDAGCTSSATCSLWCPAPTSTWPPQCSAPSSRSPTPKVSHADGRRPEVLAFAAFPRAHWQKIWSRRINDQTPIRAWGSSPSASSAPQRRMARTYLSEHSMATLSPERDTIATAELTPGN